jgi:hypothetical protein
MVLTKIIDQKKEQINLAEAQIRNSRKPVDYNTLEYPIEIIVDKYFNGKEKDENEIFIPDYQRAMAWDEDYQSKFIESILLGLPVPYIFVADVSSEVEAEEFSRLEVIDGTQRIRTLSNFLKNYLELQGLKKLTKLNGLKFDDLPPSRQIRFKRTPLRMIQLTEEADESIRRDLFERINSGSVQLNEMEKRLGGHPGIFLDLIRELSQDKCFLDLCHFSEEQKKRRDPQEYILRFFAFLYNYRNYSGKVHSFLSEFLTKTNESLSELESNSREELQLRKEDMRCQFQAMIDFVSRNCPTLFSVGMEKIRPTTRSKFESISVGIALALHEKPHLECHDFGFLKNEQFDDLTDKNSSSSKNKVIQRIEYVRDGFLKYE